jgi:hypothetical protein
VLNPLWTWIVWKEYPGALALGGGVVIIAATAIRSASPATD